MKKEIIGRLKSFLSKKFIVFFIACVFLAVGKLPAEIWAAVAAVYMGIETYQKKVIGGFNEKFGNTPGASEQTDKVE